MSKINIFALGGLGENGKNMYIVEVDSKIFILDAGMKYPDIDMYGVDGVIPNIDYLIEHKNNIEGIFVSHGHEDHIGATTYLLKKLSTRVYGTHFTISIIESMLIENKMNVSDYKLYRINANKVLTFGNVSVSFFNTTHSIPESIGICISTHDGNIVYSTDFNFGASANGTYQTTFDKITDLGKSKVLALLTESINAGAIGRITNDSVLEYNYNGILNQDYKRIIVGAFSTDLIRIQKIIDLSVAASRKIGIISSNNELIIDVAIKSNYLRIPPACYIDYQKIANSPNGKEEIAKMENVVLIVTGYRNEPYNALVHMAIGEDTSIKLNPFDKVILMCPPVPGTERTTTEAINTLCKYDTDLTIFDKGVLRSAHASPEDLKMMYAMVKPEYIIPIKGEYRHMYEQSLVAKEAGFDQNHIILKDNGEVISFVNGKLVENETKIKTGDIFIDGSSVGVVDKTVIEERTTLAEEGVIFIYGTVDLRSRKLVGKVSLSTRGLSYSFSEEELTASLGGLMERIINNALVKKSWSLDSVTNLLAGELQKYVVRYLHHRPIIVPVILEIK